MKTISGAQNVLGIWTSVYIIFNNSHGKPFLFPIKSFYVFGPCVLLIFLFKKAGVIFLERKVIFIFYSINDQEWIGGLFCATHGSGETAGYTGRASALKVTTFWRERKELHKQADN